MENTSNIHKISIPIFGIFHRRIGGTESALYNLIRGFEYTGTSDTSLYYSDMNRLSPEFQAWLASSQRTHLIKQRKLGDSGRSRFMEEIVFGLTGVDADAVIYPNYFSPPVRSARKNTIISSILHDIQYKSLPQFHSAPRRAFLDFYLPIMFRKLDVVFILSEFEREKIGTYFGAKAAEKCRVVGNAIDWNRFDTPLEENAQIESSRPFILSVCHQYPHKNLTTLLRAFSLLHSKLPQLDLVLVGVKNADNERFVADNLEAEAAKSVKFTGFVSDSQLAYYYRNCAVFAAPSIYEGFGMPAVEAIGLGAKVVLSKAGSMPETTLGFATEVENPLDPHEWADKLETAISGPGYTDEVINQLRATYDPERVASNYISHLGL